MRRQRNRINVYILLLAVIIAAIVAYYLPSRRPENASLHTPKQYIQLVEKRREERLNQLEPKADPGPQTPTAPAK